VLHDRRRAPLAAPADDGDRPNPVVSHLEEDPGRVRPIIGFPPRSTRGSRSRIVRHRAFMAGVLLLVIAAVIVMGRLVF
jgi:hypothetical protein